MAFDAVLVCSVPITSIPVSAADGLNISQLANHQDVRGLSEGRPQGIAKRCCVIPDLALCDDTLNRLVNELYWIFNCDYVAVFVLVQPVDHNSDRLPLPC